MSRPPLPSIAIRSALVAAVALSTAAHACGNGQQQVFTCKTQNNKLVEVCNAGNDATYSFGRAGAKPELFLRKPKTQLRYAYWENPIRGADRPSHSESLKFRNGPTSYTVDFTTMTDGSDSGSVEVEANDRHLTSVECRDGTVVARLEALGMHADTQTSSSTEKTGTKPQRGAGGIVFAKRAKPKVHEFIWNTHHSEGVEFDGPIRTSLGKLHEIQVRRPGYDMEVSNGLGLDGVPIAGPHGKYATIGSGSVLDYGGRLAIMYSYRADDACMACGSEAVILVGKGGKVIDQFNRPYQEYDGQEADPNRCLFPDAGKLVNGVALVQTHKGCDGPNRLMRIGYEGIEVSGG